MGNHQSSNAANPPSPYPTSELPDTFFSADSTDNSRSSDEPPPYGTCAHGDKTSEIIFRSGDGEYFSLPVTDVKAHASALVPENWSSPSVVDLPETSTILRTLFEFIGPGDHPQLFNEKFEFLAEVAKAVEKYKLSSARNTCAERMREFKDRHPKLVLIYAGHNNHPLIFDECAPRVITSENLERISPLLPDHLRLPWLKYHARWSKALTEVICYTVNNPLQWTWPICWRDCGQVIYRELATGVHSLHNIQWIFEGRVKDHTNFCAQCRNLCSGWSTHAEKLVNEIGTFHATCVDSVEKEPPVTATS